MLKPASKYPYEERAILPGRPWPRVLRLGGISICASRCPVALKSHSPGARRRPTAGELKEGNLLSSVRDARARARGGPCGVGPRVTADGLLVYVVIARQDVRRRRAEHAYSRGALLRGCRFNAEKRKRCEQNHIRCACDEGFTGDVCGDVALVGGGDDVKHASKSAFIALVTLLTALTIVSICLSIYASRVQRRVANYERILVEGGQMGDTGNFEAPAPDEFPRVEMKSICDPRVSPLHYDEAEGV